MESAHQLVPCTIHKTYKPHFSAIFSLKMGLMALFTYLKFILLQYFQFSIFNKINNIQTDLQFSLSLLSISFCFFILLVKKIIKFYLFAFSFFFFCNINIFKFFYYQNLYNSSLGILKIILKPPHLDTNIVHLTGC